MKHKHALVVGEGSTFFVPTKVVLFKNKADAVVAHYKHWKQRNMESYVVPVELEEDNND